LKQVLSGASASMLTHANQLHSSPTMKLKRKAISEAFNRVIDAMYDE
jgi:hypothetical protein